MQSTVADSYSTDTLIGSFIGLATLLPIQQTIDNMMSLNAHLNIHPTELLSESPKLRYYGVGIRGCYNADDKILSNPYNPQRTNMNLFSLIPLRCRPIDEDLTDVERAEYRLRKRQAINGNEYFLYFLKVLKYGTSIGYKKIKANGEEEPYDLNPEHLQPEPVKPTADTTIDSDLASIVAYATASVHVEASEVLEYIRLMYSGDTRYSKISELGFFTGEDRQVTGTTGLQNEPITYMESIGTMLYNHNTWTGSPLTHEGMHIAADYEITSQGAITYK